VPDVAGGPALGLRERKKQQTRKTLIDAAVQLCARQGYERTTVDQIAAVADVSPRTFSRYFATKDAVMLAFIDEFVELVAAELVRQPADKNELEALFCAHVQAFRGATSSPPGGVTAERLLDSARIITSSSALMHAASQFRIDAVNSVLAERMSVAADDARLKLVSALWGAIVMTALGGLGPHDDWSTMSVDTIVGRLETTYAQFLDVTAGVGQPV
jgi:AcrR family transcriptional regulator